MAAAAITVAFGTSRKYLRLIPEKLGKEEEDESDGEVASFHDQPPGQGEQEEGGLPAHLRDPNFNQMGNRALRGATPSRSPVGGDVSEDNDDG